MGEGLERGGAVTGPEREYYMGQGKQDSAMVAGGCFVALLAMVVIGALVKVVTWLEGLF